MSEADFITALQGLPLHSGARGLNDDCAVLEFGSETLILNHDMMAEGAHFRTDADMFDVAWKLTASNLSDLAAKGAAPIGVLLGYSLGDQDERFLTGLREALSEYKTPLLGGDTIASNGPRTFGLTAIGRATHKPVPSRSGAKAGDSIYVTGVLGGAMLGFEGSAQYLDAFNRPRALISEGQALAPHVTAMMDVSDGLLLDAQRMATASDCSFEIESAAVPVAQPVRRSECMRWGDDYQLLFTAPSNTPLPITAAKIGMVSQRGPAGLWIDGELPNASEVLGYQHNN